MGEYGNSAVRAKEKLEASRAGSGEKNKTLLIIFIAFMAVCYVGGLFVGRFLANNETDLHSIFTGIGTFLKLNMCYIALVVNIVMGVIGFALYGNVEKLANKWDGEDDDLINEVESKLFYPGAISTLMMLFNFFAFGVSLCHLSLGDAYKDRFIFIVAFSTSILLFSFIGEMILQGKCLSLEKKLNPEKRGNILDIKFQEKWFDSCDEAEKMIVYKASYDAFKYSSYIYAVAWILAVMADLIFKSGILPVTMVSAMWIIQTVIYLRASRKYSM
ncbi:DUF3169 family protein [Butyrivibrio sp. VCD2006]|uniref:DUF3169 family protein n=1 Tax=Butyrivibrio sp. VCD2006 TaxID=1280664 RepID=UPI00041DD31B|nr:DUF3169 family protein [Butyrivibrio sp. VCD2006]